MVEYHEGDLDAAFSALSDHTRRAIVARLAAEELTVSEVAAPFDMTLAAVSKHLGVLAKAGLIDQRKEGRSRRCRLRPETLKGVAEWVETYRRFWEERLESLSDYFDGLDAEAEAEPNNDQER